MSCADEYGGWICTLSIDHGGRHESHQPDGWVVADWPTSQECIHHYVMVIGGMQCRKCGKPLANTPVGAREE